MQFEWVPTTYAFIYMLWVLIWIALTSWCISNGYQQHTLLYICWGYSFELHWQVDVFQMGTNNIPFYIYVVGTHLNCTDKLMHFKWVPTTYPFIYMLWVLIWIALTSWCISNGYQQHTLLYICCGYSFELHWQVDALQMGTNNIRFYIYLLWVLIWIALTSWCISNGYQQETFIFMLWVLIFNCTDKLMHFKWVPTTFTFIYMLWVPIWIALTSQCISNGYQQHMLFCICCGFSFELHWRCISNGYQQHTLLYICYGYSFEVPWQVDVFQMGTNNIHFYIYVVRTHLNCIDKSMQFKWVLTTYAFIKK